jgi:hypothetical protein
MLKHGALSRSHVYHLLRSKDARVRHAAFTLLERSNPTLRINSRLFVEITRFREKQNKQSSAADELTDNTRPCEHEGGFLKKTVLASI